MELNFPQIPKAKQYGELMTPEQLAWQKILTGIQLNSSDISVLEEAINFYQVAFPYLKSIDLSIVNESEAEAILAYLKVVFNAEIIIQNNIRFELVYRVAFVKDIFLEDGKIRDVKYISYPPLEIVKSLGVYGRANSPNSTCFYCSFEAWVALLETKPSAGTRIIISIWKKEDNNPFVTYPITNNDTINNEGVFKATKAFQDSMKFNHPLFAKTLDLYLKFLSSEYIKDIPITNPKKYEYLYSAFFADMTLDNNFQFPPEDKNPLPHYDAILYPSVAFKHKSDNLAIVPSSVNRLNPVYLEDCIVMKTDYNNQNLTQGKLPILKKTLRESEKIIDGRIFWNDDIA